MPRDRATHLQRPRTLLGRLLLVVSAWLVAGLAISRPASAQATGELSVGPPPELGDLEGRVVNEVVVRFDTDLWNERVEVRSVRPGDLASGEVVRRALRELDRSGKYANLRAELVEEAGRLSLVVHVTPRRLVHQVRFVGGVLSDSEEERALGLREGDDVTPNELKRATKRLIELYAERGYTSPYIAIIPEAVDDPRRTLLRVRIEPGEASNIETLRFQVHPSPHRPELIPLIEGFDLDVGDRLDREAVEDALDELLEDLKEAQFYSAELSYQVDRPGALVVFVRSGPLFRLRFEGNEEYGALELSSRLALAEERDPRPGVLESRLLEFYRQRGYLDALVSVSRLDDAAGLVSELVIRVRAGERFRVEGREFVCGQDAFRTGRLDEEIDGVLVEQFPPQPRLGPAPSDAAHLGPHSSPWAERRRAPTHQPWRQATSDAYEQVVTHLQDLYRAEGYLDALVGPAFIQRHPCAPESPPGECIVRSASELEVNCSAQEIETPVVETCVPDFEAGIRCASVGRLVLPIRQGPRAILYDVVLEGNQHFTEAQLLEWAELPIGGPLRRADLDQGLQAIEEHYLDDAFTFVQVDSEIELSEDKTRARLVISIVERSRVRIERIDVRGASETSESLIRSRLSIEEGGYYRQRRVRKSQEQIESLGVFTSVTVGLADPQVPAKRKVVVVLVNERLPQYLDTKGGFASADGFRIAFEYGHRNLGGEAIRLTLRSQLALRPLFLITESDVRRKYEELSALELLERRNTITLGFPNVGLGPLFSFEAELLDLRSNERDFSQSRDAVVLRLLFRPRRENLFSLGGTIELNDATILGGESLEDYVQNNPGVDIRVPEGRSIAYTQNVGGSWDRRDQPLLATRGTYLAASVEHVTAVPLGDNEGGCNEDSGRVFAPVCSELLRLTAKVAGYLPLSRRGLALAVSVRGGVIQHLTNNSRTYPDRLFFMGGVDTLRGYTQYSLVPQDRADSILRDDELTIDEVVLRGGDIFINPRVELRIPLSDSLQTAWFVDSGNLWEDRDRFNPLELRTTTGTGLRVKTPVGPLVFDYGFNISKVLDGIFGERQDSRSWEDLGAFHFSIGLF